MLIPANLRLTGWINWFVVLTFGPLIAFLLADVCGYEPTAETFKVILLVEVCLVIGGVVVLLLVQALGPLTDREMEATRSFQLPQIAPGSALEEVTVRPAAWNRRIQSYLRNAWMDVAIKDRLGRADSGKLHRSNEPEWLADEVANDAARSEGRRVGPMARDIVRGPSAGGRAEGEDRPASKGRSDGGRDPSGTPAGRRRPPSRR